MFKLINFFVVVTFFAARVPLAVAQGALTSDESAKQLFYKMEDRLSRATSLECAITQRSSRAPANREGRS
jgi:hypothetical protein